MTRRSLLGSMPNVLIVHLQRLEFDHNTFQLKKVISKFEFPKILTLEPFAFKENSKSFQCDSEAERAELESYLKMKSEDFEYRLVGVNIHRGTGTHGHYWSYINTKRGREEPDPAHDDTEWRNSIDFDWKEFNDNEVSGYSIAQMPEDAYGGSQNLTHYELDLAAHSTQYGDSYGKSAYMLIYERRVKTDIREVVTKATEEAEEVIKKVDYRNIMPEVPDQIRQMVQKNNFELMIDRQVFDKQFFVLIQHTFKHISSELAMSSHHYSLDYYPHFNKMNDLSLKIGHKVCFEFLTHF